MFGNSIEGIMAGNGGLSLGVRVLLFIFFCIVIFGENRDLFSFR